MKKGSALLSALVTIAVLSIMMMSFVYEAKQQAGINVYVRERNRVNRLVDAGRILGEIVITGFKDVAEWSVDQDLEKFLEEDRWFVEKQELKMNSKCKIGPILLDESNTESGTVTVEIETVNSGDKGIININNLYKGGGDSKYMERWWMIFLAHGIPEELSTPKDGVINLWNTLIASWDDWRDDDDTPSAIDGVECGAEKSWYEEYEEENDIDEEDRKRPRNGPIPDIRELSYVRGFREYPQVLTGGVINPWEPREEDRIEVRGIEGLFTTEGSSKININSCKNIDALITIPGIYDDPTADDALEEAKAVAQAVINGLAEIPESRDVDETKTSWPFKDWSDLTSRTDEDIGNDASKYLSFGLDENTLFRMKIIGESMGMKCEANAECYIRDSKVRYVKWREN
jgi:hypothetical protein